MFLNAPLTWFPSFVFKKLFTYLPLLKQFIWYLCNKNLTKLNRASQTHYVEIQAFAEPQNIDIFQQKMYYKYATWNHSQEHVSMKNKQTNQAAELDMTGC